MNRHRLSPFVLMIGVVFGLAPLTLSCDEDDEITVEEPENDPNLPPANVNLPPAPPASGFEVAERNPDNTLRVEGLIHHRANHLDQQVEVKGLVVRISAPCDPKKAKRNDETCPEPNLFIKDDEDGQKFLRIVGYDEDFIKKAKLEVGETRVFKGTYKKVAQGFVATEDGLVLLDYVDDIPVLEDK